MMQRLYETRAVSYILAERRRRRVRFLLSKVSTKPGMSILDVGCGTDGRSFEDHLPHDCCITGIDLEDPAEVTIRHPRFRYYRRDAVDLSIFETKSFDLAVSIGMMEHVCDRAVLQRIASEIARVARQWIIVVPWRYCWIEPHFKFPVFQFLPWRAMNTVTHLFNLHNMGEFVKERPVFIRENFQWLASREWRDIFQADHVYLLPTLEMIAIIKREDRIEGEGAGEKGHDTREEDCGACCSVPGSGN